MSKKILFITGTRADYGKMKPLMLALKNDSKFELFVFVCGMHLSETFGRTYEEILKDNYKNVYVAFGLTLFQNTSINLGNTIAHLSGYVDQIDPDMIVVHGDRFEAMAGAMVGAIKNKIVAHIEGGEISGTIDESIRHAISKFAHVHFVSTDRAKQRLIQMGEESNRIYVIGSPDIDIMLSKNLPSLEETKKRYEINFDSYSILMYHPVTTEYNSNNEKIKIIVDAIIESQKDYVVIKPNNDLGFEIILNEYKRLEKDHQRFRIFPSIRFEYFLTLLKNANFIIGNSSAGIRESGVYGIPTIDIGSRQRNRGGVLNIQHVEENIEEILKAIKNVDYYRVKVLAFGKGKSKEKFLKIINEESFWDINIQKNFVDLDM